MTILQESTDQIFKMQRISSNLLKYIFDFIFSPWFERWPRIVGQEIPRAVSLIVTWRQFSVSESMLCLKLFENTHTRMRKDRLNEHGLVEKFREWCPLREASLWHFAGCFIWFGKVHGRAEGNPKMAPMHTFPICSNTFLRSSERQ